MPKKETLFARSHDSCSFIINSNDNCNEISTATLSMTATSASTSTTPSVAAVIDSSEQLTAGRKQQMSKASSKESVTSGKQQMASSTQQSSTWHAGEHSAWPARRLRGQARRV